MKCLLITGASAGIGLHTAQRFIKEGYSVINLSRRRCPLPKVKHMNCDLAAAGFMENLIPQLTPLLKEAEQIVLVHNALEYFQVGPCLTFLPAKYATYGVVSILSH